MMMMIMRKRKMVMMMIMIMIMGCLLCSADKDILLLNWMVRMVMRKLGLVAMFFMTNDE